MRIAVIGAGISGLNAGRLLRGGGHAVTVFDKGRGVGGRTSRRRSAAFEFDHGAQYFTARDERFRRMVAGWLREGIVAEWTGRIARIDGRNTTLLDNRETTRYVGVPGMNAMAKALADGLAVQTQTRVGRPVRSGEAWQLRRDDGQTLGVFDALIVALPAAQAADLLQDVSALADRAQAVRLAPCWAVMLGFERPLEVGFDGAFVEAAPLSWVARNRSKPGRSAGEAWVLHASPAWSAAHLEDEAGDVADTLAAEFREIVGAAARQPVFTDVHRWRYSLPPEPLEAGCLWDAQQALAVCGDWCQGARIEGAFLSGLAAAARLLGQG